MAPAGRPKNRATPDTALLVEPELTIGAQARVFSRACAEHILKEFHPSAWHQDLALARLAAELVPLHYHVHSPLEHLRVQSTWSGLQHRAMDFDPEWGRLGVREGCVFIDEDLLDNPCANEDKLKCKALSARLLQPAL